MSKQIKPVISFTLDEELIKRIEDFQFKNRIGSRSKAVAKLIEMGLSEWEDSGEQEAEELQMFDPIEEMEQLKKMLEEMQQRMIKHRSGKSDDSYGSGKYITHDSKGNPLHVGQTSAFTMSASEHERYLNSIFEPFHKNKEGK